MVNIRNVNPLPTSTHSFSQKPFPNNKTSKVTEHLFYVIQAHFLNQPDSLAEHKLTPITTKEKNALNKFITVLAGFLKKTLHLPLSQESLAEKINTFVQNFSLNNKGAIPSHTQINQLVLSIIKEIKLEQAKSLIGRVGPAINKT